MNTIIKWTFIPVTSFDPPSNTHTLLRDKTWTWAKWLLPVHARKTQLIRSQAQAVGLSGCQRWAFCCVSLCLGCKWWVLLLTSPSLIQFLFSVCSLNFCVFLYQIFAQWVWSFLRLLPMTRNHIIRSNSKLKWKERL